MKTIRRISVPTGDIFIVEGENGKLECLSLGDYGKTANIKASFLGLDRDIERVEHQRMLPLEKKWVITISTQYGCSMGCSFCDVPRVGPGRNATTADLIEQFWTAFSLHPEVTYSDRVNLHYARMGEPTFNRNVITSAYAINERLKGNTKYRMYARSSDFLLHPVVSTMMPAHNKNLESFLSEWCDIKNCYFFGNAGLQLSINSTDDWERHTMFHGNAMLLEDVSFLAGRLPPPIGRKYTLNFAIAGWKINAKRLAKLFDAKKFIVKLTPIHKTTEAVTNGIKTAGDYTTLAPYKEIEESLKESGFDVLVFIASREEDEGRITCGNAILSGTEPMA